MSLVSQCNKLALGTVQFGLPYGIANKKGQVSTQEVKSILDLAQRNGVNNLDTAIAYGESETVLGAFSLSDFEIITKLPPLPDNCQNIQGWVDKELQDSFARLKVSSVSGLLLHCPDDLLSPSGTALYRALQTKKKEGFVKNIGVSIYSPDELELLTKYYQFDLIQAPFNMLDHRLDDGSWFKKLEQVGTRLHVRSIFMQGLLLMSSNDRPKKFDRWSSLWNLWDEWIKDMGITPLQACLCHALSVPEIEKIVIGVDSTNQFNQILQAAHGSIPVPPAELKSVDINLLNPSLWNNL